MKTPKEIQEALSHCYGTESYYRVRSVPLFLLTDGVKTLCDMAECYWLLDIIASYQSGCRLDSMLKEMQFWKLVVSDHKGIVTCERDENDVAITQHIESTDFPLPEIKIWVQLADQNGTMVAMLPTEY